MAGTLLDITSTIYINFLLVDPLCRRAGAWSEAQIDGPQKGALRLTQNAGSWPYIRLNR